MPKVARVVDTPNEVIPAKGSPWAEVDAIFVNHSAFRDVRESIEALMPLQGTGSAMPCIPFVGPTGIGKTTIYRKLMEAFPAVKDARVVELDDGERLVCDHVPILCVRMPTTINETAVLKLMLKALGDRFANRGDKGEKLERLILLLAACGTKLVVIDEGQRLVERTGVLTANKVIDMLKDIHEMACVSFVMLALERIKQLYEEDGQIERRWSRQREILPYAWGRLDASEDQVPQSRLDFIGLLAGFAASCPIAFAEDLDLTTDVVAYRFYYVSRGVAGYIKKLLLSAMSIVKPGGIVDLALLSNAFRAEFRTDMKNKVMEDPFVTDWIPRPPPPLVDDGAPGRRRRPRPDDGTAAPPRRKSPARAPGKDRPRPRRAKDVDAALRQALSRR